jgi:uncharacterized Zn finger protein
VEIGTPKVELGQQPGAMTWKKVVKLVAVSACPICGNRGFDLEPGADIDDLRAMVRCGKCGHVCPAYQFMKTPESKETT